MNRKSFIASLAAFFMPWKKVQAKPVIKLGFDPIRADERLKVWEIIFENDKGEPMCSLLSAQSKEVHGVHVNQRISVSGTEKELAVWLKKEHGLDLPPLEERNSSFKKMKEAWLESRFYHIPGKNGKVYGEL